MYTITLGSNNNDGQYLTNECVVSISSLDKETEIRLGIHMYVRYRVFKDVIKETNQTYLIYL